jgi:hypothetical protein
MSHVRPIPMPENPISRSARREVRNPVLALPSAPFVQALPVEIRAPLGDCLRQLAREANAEDRAAWQGAGWRDSGYWSTAAVYAQHLARAIAPRSKRDSRNRDVHSVAVAAPRLAAFMLARNPLLRLPAAAALLALSPACLAALAVLLRELSDAARASAAKCRTRGKRWMGVYWRNVSAAARPLSTLLAAEARRRTPPDDGSRFQAVLHQHHAP